MSKPRFKRPAAKPFDIKDAKFAYFSTCCQALAKKPALQTPTGNRIGQHLGAAPNTESQTEGLGGWRCSNCNKPCSCTRSRKTEDAVAA